MNYFVTGIGTDSGKTVTSAIITQALQADYWKPIQSGLPTDTDIVRNLVDNPKSVFHNEAYTFKKPVSPHAASKEEDITIRMDNIFLPETDNDLVIEGAGGVLVPLNQHDFIIDLVPVFNAEVILVVDLYLGCINHTLLTAELLHQRNYRIKGIVFNGEENKSSEEIILEHTGYKQLLRINKEENVDDHMINRYAIDLLKDWDK